MFLSNCFELSIRRSNCCLLFFPVICLVFIFLLQVVTKDLTNNFLSEQGLANTKVNSTSVELSQLMVQVKNSQNLTFNPPESIYFSSNRKDYLDNINFGQLSSKFGVSNGFLKDFSPISRKIPSMQVNGTFETSGMISIPYSVSSFNNSTEMENVIYEKLASDGKSKHALDAVGGYIINQLTTSTRAVLNYTIQYDSNEKSLFCDYLSKTIPISFVITSCRNVMGVSMQNWMNDAFLKNITGRYHIRTYTSQMSYTISFPSANISDLLGSLFFPMILCLLLPSFTFTIVMEKQFKLREMMKLMGMKMRYYFLVSYMFFYGMYAISVVMFVIFSALFNFSFVSKTNPIILSKYC